MVLAPGSMNLILPDCRKFNHSVTYRGFNTTQDPVTTVEPSDVNAASDRRALMQWAMEETRNVSCSVICRDGSCTYQMPAGVRTGDHCDYAWMSADGMVLDHGRKNLTLPDCRKEIHFVTRCDDTAVDHSVTYRAFNTTKVPITMDPSGIEIWLPILMVLFLVVIGLFIMYRLKMFCFKRANGPNPADGNRDLRDAEDDVSGASVPLNNNQTSSGPNCNGVKTDHKNGGENIPMVPISNGGSHSLNHDPPPPV